MKFDNVKGNQSKKKKDEEPSAEEISISDEDIEKGFGEDIASPIRAIFYGKDGTGKTGSAMDILEPGTDEMVYVLDCDGGSGPVKQEYFTDNKNIKIFNPLTLTDKGEIDYATSYRKCLKWTEYVYRKHSEENVKATILDGLDTLQEWCQVLMKIEDLKADPTTRVNESWMWEKRNKRVLQVVVPISRMSSHRILITHMKDIKDFVKDPNSQRTSLKTVDYEPIYISKLPGMMNQKIEFTRTDKDKVVELKAKVHKSKTKLGLEGKEYTVAKVDQNTEEESWYGLRDFYSDLGLRE